MNKIKFYKIWKTLPKKQQIIVWQENGFEIVQCWGYIFGNINHVLTFKRRIKI
jgi:hypothetical protein